MVKQCGPRQVAAVALAACALFAASAQAATVDFESISPNLFFGGDSFEEAGFRLTVGGDFGAVDTAAGCFGAVCPSGNDTQFYMGLNDSHVSLARADGSAFSLRSFDAGFIAPVPQVEGTYAGLIQLHAVRSDGGHVYLSYDLGASGVDGSYSFASYGNAALGIAQLGSVTSIDFFACSFDGTGACANPNANLSQFALDNLNLAAAVPEPSSVALLALGLAGIGLRRRRAAR